MSTTANRKRAAARRAPAKPVIELPTDYLGDKGRAELAANQIISIAAERERVHMVRIANAHAPSDAVPGMDAGPDGNVPTYAEREEHFTQAIQRLEAAYSDLMPMIEKLLKERDANSEGGP